MAEIPRVSEKGAEKLMESLVTKGFFKGADHDSVIVKTASGFYSTISHLGAGLTHSLKSPGTLVDASDAAARMGISLDYSRRVLLSLRETDAFEVHPIKPSQSSCTYEADAPRIIINKAAMDQFLCDESKCILESTEKAKSLGDIVDNLLDIPEHISSLSSLRLDAIDWLRNLILLRLAADPKLTIMQRQQDVVVLATDYLSTSRFSLAFQKDLTERLEPALVQQIIAELDTDPLLRPDLTWIIENLQNIPGHFCRDPRNKSEQLFVPRCHVETIKRQVLSSFASHGVWTTNHMLEAAEYDGASWMTPKLWLQQSYPAATVLTNAVVREDVVQVLADTVCESESWLNLQSIIPMDLDDEDTEALLNEHILKGKRLGKASALNSQSLYIPQALVDELRHKVVPSLLCSLSKNHAARTITNAEPGNQRGNENTQLGKSRKGKLEQDDALPRHELVQALLAKYTELFDYVHESDETSDRLALVELLMSRLFESDDTLDDMHEAFFRDEVQRLKAEQDRATQQVQKRNISDSSVAFEDPRCFATACYMIQLMWIFVEHFESTIEKDNPTDMAMLDSIYKDALQSICSNFAWRLTMCCLEKCEPTDHDVAFVIMDSNELLEHYCSPMDVARACYPSIRMTSRSHGEDDPLRVLRAVLDTSVAKSVCRMWTLLGDECYGRRHGVKAGDIRGFLSHVKEECITICGLPFKILDKKAKKQLLNERRQMLVQDLATATDASLVVELSVMHLFQHVKSQVVFGQHLRGTVLQCLVREKKVSEELATMLQELAASIDCGDNIPSEIVEKLKEMALGKA